LRIRSKWRKKGIGEGIWNQNVEKVREGDEWGSKSSIWTVYESGGEIAGDLLADFKCHNFMSVILACNPQGKSIIIRLSVIRCHPRIQPSDILKDCLRKKSTPRVTSFSGWDDWFLGRDRGSNLPGWASFFCFDLLNWHPKTLTILPSAPWDDGSEFWMWCQVVSSMDDVNQWIHDRTCLGIFPRSR
jgi:hypothetical protein